MRVLYVLVFLFLTSPSFAASLVPAKAEAAYGSALQYFSDDPQNSNEPRRDDVVVVYRSGVLLWKFICQNSTCRVVGDNDKLVFLKETDRSGNVEALVALDAKDGSKVWRQNLVPSAMGNKTLLLTTAGKLVIAQKGRNAFHIFDATTGRLLTETPLPVGVTGDELDNYFYSYDFSIGDSGVNYWGLPGGRLYAKVGNQALWSLHYNQYRDADRRAPASKVYGFRELNQNAVAVVIAPDGQDDGKLFMPILDIKTGKQLAILPTATSFSKDSNYFYVRHINTVAAYDRRTYKQKWTSPVLGLSYGNNSLVTDDKYVYTAKLRNQLGRWFVSILLIDKSTGNLQDSVDLGSSYINEIQLGRVANTLIVHSVLNQPGEAGGSFLKNYYFKVK